MNKQSTKTLIYIIVVLAVLNIGTFISIGINIHRAKTTLPAPATESIKAAQNYNGRFFRDLLKLSPEQMDEFRKVNDEFRSSARDINNELNTLRIEMMAEMQTDSPRNHLLDLQSDSIGTLHANLKKDTYKYYMGIKSLCNKQQTEKLNEIFETFFAPPPPPGHPPGKRHEHGRNRQENPRK